jgi:hypothetical protein
MSCKKLFASAIVAAFGLALAVASVAQADPAKDKAPAGLGDFKLPEGWTMEDLQACMAAGTPGEMHKKLGKEVGKWQGKHTMWMAPGAAPVTSECTATVTPLMDGRFVQTEFNGEIPGMGPYNGLGVTGFDNVSKKFQATWLDNHSTGIMIGTGEISDDGKTLTWKYECSCPITKKPTEMRQVETYSSPTSKKMEMFGTDPKSGKEFKMMSIELTKK